MAIGLASGMKVKDPFIHSSLVETLTQNFNAFNAASRGAIRLTTVSRPGDYFDETFLANVAGLVTRRDTTSVAAATSLALPQDENTWVKLNRKIGPVENTLDSLRKVTKNENAMRVAIGRQSAVAMQLDMLNAGLLAGRAALNAQAAVKHTAAATLTTADLVDGLSKFGDGASRIVAWVMHSKPYYDLVKAQIAANIDGVSNFNVASATPVTMNRPVLVTDSASLIDTVASPDNYFTLGLVANGVQLENTETEDVVTERVTGLENLTYRIQGEFAYNAVVRGFKWDKTNGGANPLDAALGTGTNWDPAWQDSKDYAGVIIQST